MKRLICPLGLFALLAPSARAQVGDQYLLTIDTVHTAVEFVIETDLHGICLPVNGPNCPLYGELDVELHGGLLPIASGSYEGGDATCLGKMASYVPNVLPILPPLLEVDVEDLRIAPTSNPFLVNANGNFLVDEAFQVLDGRLVVRSLGLDAIAVPLIGMTSDVVRTNGRVEIDPNGVRLVRQLGNSLVVDVPALGLQVRVSLRGVVEAQFHYPLPTETCPSTANHLGTLATIALTGTVSVSRDDLALRCLGAVPGARSIGILGSLRTSVPFGAGTLCIGGPLVRLGSLDLGVDGSGALSVHLGALGVQVGTTRLLQAVYRDGASYNLTNALEILACP